MNLLEVRKKFREISGRYDLVNDDFSDNGANFFINEGSKWLDRTVEHQKSWATHMQILTAGAWNAQFPHCRAIKEVWATTVDGKRQLTKMKLQDLIASRFTQIPADWTNGTPHHYSPFLTRYIPEDISALTLASFAAYIGIMPSTGYDYNAIILSRPVDQDTLIEVIGLFYSILLTQDVDDNYWSSVHPLLLIQAAIARTYTTSGNAPMLKMYQDSIREELTQIGMDLVEELVAESDQMEG